MEIKLPSHLENEPESKYLERCREILFNGVREAGYDPETMYPSAIEGFTTNANTITYNVTMECDRFNKE